MVPEQSDFALPDQNYLESVQDETNKRLQQALFEQQYLTPVLDLPRELSTPMPLAPLQSRYLDPGDFLGEGEDAFIENFDFIAPDFGQPMVSGLVDDDYGDLDDAQDDLTTPPILKDAQHVDGIFVLTPSFFRGKLKLQQRKRTRHPPPDDDANVGFDRLSINTIGKAKYIYNLLD